jgi:hypothetical protein
LFERLKDHPDFADQLAAVRSLVNAAHPMFETEYLDFKAGCAPPANNPIPDANVKKTWSEALAGFANTIGGVLIWGIDARKPAGGDVDAAHEFLLVPDPNALRSRLQELHHQATDPPVPGVELLAIADPVEKGNGFVVCYIPESDYKPHRAELASKRWMIRVGDSFVDTPVPFLRNLFFPHRQSYMYLRVGRTSQLQVGQFTYRVRLYNEGPATAKDILIVVKRVHNLKVVAPQSWNHAPQSDGWHVRHPHPLHPGQMVHFFDIQIELTQAQDVKFEFQIFALDQPPSSYAVTVPTIGGAEQTATPTPLAVDRFR